MQDSLLLKKFNTLPKNVLIVKVEDTGIGIKEKDFKNLF